MNSILSALATGVVAAMWKLYDRKKADDNASAASQLHALEDIARKQKDLLDRARVYCNWAEGQLKVKDAEISRLTALVASLSREKPHPIDQNPY